jgi:hypothetical protein
MKEHIKVYPGDVVRQKKKIGSFTSLARRAALGTIISEVGIGVAASEENILAMALITAVLALSTHATYRHLSNLKKATDLLKTYERIRNPFSKSKTQTIDLNPTEYTYIP